MPWSLQSLISKNICWPGFSTDPARGNSSYGLNPVFFGYGQPVVPQMSLIVRLWPLKFMILNCRVLSTLLVDISSSIADDFVTASPVTGWDIVVPAAVDNSAAFAADAMPVNPMKIEATVTVITLGAVRMNICSLRTLLAGRSGGRRALP